MIACRPFAVITAAAALLLSAGCGGNNAVTGDETSDPLYQQAQSLKKQDRNGEALAAFIKVIDRRGENGAPESHLEAGALYLTWAKDPVEAYHHFQKYLTLQPTGPRADMVRGQRDAAKRELARVLLAPPGDPLAIGTDRNEVDQLRRRVQELEAELQMLHGASATPVLNGPPVISLGGDEPAPAPPIQPIVEPTPSAPPRNSGATSGGGSGLVRGLSAPPRTVPSTPAPGAVRNTVANDRGTANPTRPPTTPQRPAAPTGRTHTVAQKDSLWSIARQYYRGETTNAKVNGIYEANRDVMKSPGDLRAGMVLRIP